MNFRSDVGHGSSKSSGAMAWVHEVDSAKSIADHKISKPIPGQSSGDFEYFDAKVARGLKKVINGDFKRRVFTDEEHGTQREAISWMVYEFLMISDTDEKSLGSH